MKQLHNFKPTS